MKLREFINLVKVCPFCNKNVYSNLLTETINNKDYAFFYTEYINDSIGNQIRLLDKIKIYLSLDDNEVIIKSGLIFNIFRFFKRYNFRLHLYLQCIRCDYWISPSPQDITLQINSSYNNEFVIEREIFLLSKGDNKYEISNLFSPNKSKFSSIVCFQRIQKQSNHFRHNEINNFPRLSYIESKQTKEYYLNKLNKYLLLI